MKGILLSLFLVLGPGPLAVAPAGGAETVTLEPTQDNSLYEDAAGSLSNGAGSRLFVGRTAAGANSLRRALVQFDVAGAIPSGSQILDVRLTLSVAQTSDTTPRLIRVHRLFAAWGEGTTAAPGAQGSGGPATTGSATWLHRFWPSDSWVAAGGDFPAGASDTAVVGASGSSTTWSGAGLRADVLLWLDDPSTQHGWLLLGEEDTSSTSRAFSSREETTAASRPHLQVTFEPPVAVHPATWGRVKRGPAAR